MQIHSNLNNIFDQYHVEENRITNALLQTLARNRELLKVFLQRYFGISPKRNSKVVISCQKEPFSTGDQAENQVEIQSVPDGWIIIDETTAIVFETKIAPNSIRRDQTKSHIKRIKHFEGKFLCIITPDDGSPIDKDQIDGAKVKWLSWKDVYGLVRKYRLSQSETSNYLTEQLKEFLAMKEDLVGFQGISYSNGKYDTREAKIILRNLLREIKRDIKKDYPLLISERKAILEEGHAYTVYHRSIWSFLGVSGNFTRDLHITFWLHETHLGVGITIPNSAKKIWRRLKAICKDDGLFDAFIERLLKLRSYVPNLYLEFVHRHYLRQRDGIVDGILELNIDTIGTNGNTAVKRNPLWFHAIRELMKHKKGYNGQLMVRVRYFYKDHPGMQDARFKNTVIETIRKFKDVYEYLRT